MKISKLLNKKNFSIIIIFCFFGLNCLAEDQPVDIWNIDEKESSDNSNNSTSVLENIDENNQLFDSEIYKMQSEKQIDKIELNNTIESKEIKILGLYDPEDYGLSIDMWSNSNGDQLKILFTNLAKLNLSRDAAEIMNISLFTNAYYPNKNISEEEFTNIKSQWLIKNSDYKLIEEYLIKNQIINIHPVLTRYLVDQYLSESNVSKACSIFSKNLEPIKDEYLSKFNLYCLVNDKKNEEAQIIFDLKKEMGFKNDYYETKLNYLFGYTDKIDKTISEKNILDFHLAHRTNPEFIFEPNDKTDPLIWKYLSSANLLYNIEDIEITDLDKISLIEKATHNKNYSEKDLFELYKRFQFSINQLLNAQEAYKSLSNIEARALVFQRLLLESETSVRLKLIKLLKDLFEKENLEKAFDIQLKLFLEDLNPEDVPSNLSTFYFTNIINEDAVDSKIKFNNDVMHQSKLINYFNGDYAKSKIEKDVNNFLKKIKKNKKYFVSKKDIILIESLKSDGVKISKKYDGLYEIIDTEMPTDIQVMINNNETGAAILRIIEVIGQDDLKALDEDTLYFIISTLNQLNIDFIRNKILLKVLPLKV
jgi:hypothetical protein